MTVKERAIKYFDHLQSEKDNKKRFKYLQYLCRKSETNPEINDAVVYLGMKLLKYLK